MTRHTTARIAAWGVALASGAAMVSGAAMLLAFRAAHPNLLPASLVVALLYNVPLTVAFIVVSLAILRRLPQHPIGWLFGMLAVIVGYSLFVNGYVRWGLPGAAWATWVWVVVASLTFFSLAMALLLFPTGRTATPRWRWLAALLWVYLVVAVLIGAVAPWPNTNELVASPADLSWQEPNPIGVHAPDWLAVANSLIPTIGVLLLLVALLSLLPRWRRARGDEREQIKWLGLAGLVFAVELTAGLIQALTVGFPEDDALAALVGGAMFVLALVSIPVAMGFGIARYRLYDIDAIISKTVIYGTLIVFILLVYITSVVLVGGLVSRWAGSSTLLALVATAGVAVAFHPLRRSLQTRADRWVYGPRAAPYELMSRFGRDLAHAVAPGDVLARIAETTGHAVRATASRVTVDLPDGSTQTADWPDASAADGFDVVVPVRDDNRLIGAIAAAGAGARPADSQLLRDIAGVSTAALRNVRLVAELESLYDAIQEQNREISASRDRLTTAAEDERRRLKELAVKRLEPHLDALHEALPRLRAQLDEDPHQAATECEHLVGHTTHLLDEIRALSRGLIPPILTDHGLVAALRALLRRVDIQTTLDAPPSTTAARYPDHVETTVYLCCRAAIEAAARAHHITTAGIRLWRDGSDLSFSIAHEPPLSTQTDLITARDRIATLGGELTIAQEGKRSTILGTVPLGTA